MTPPDTGWVDSMVGRDPSTFMWAVLIVLAVVLLAYSPIAKAVANAIAGWADRRRG